MSTGIAFIFLAWQYADMTTHYGRYLEAAAKRRKRIIALHKQGFTQAEIARKMRVSRQRINTIILKGE